MREHVIPLESAHAEGEPDRRPSHGPIQHRKRRLRLEPLEAVCEGPSVADAEYRRARKDGQYDLVYETAELMEPDPYPKGYQ